MTCPDEELNFSHEPDIQGQLMESTVSEKVADNQKLLEEFQVSSLKLVMVYRLSSPYHLPQTRSSTPFVNSQIDSK